MTDCQYAHLMLLRGLIDIEVRNEVRLVRLVEIAEAKAGNIQLALLGFFFLYLLCRLFPFAVFPFSLQFDKITRRLEGFLQRFAPIVRRLRQYGAFLSIQVATLHLCFLQIPVFRVRLVVYVCQRHRPLSDPSSNSPTLKLLRREVDLALSGSDSRPGYLQISRSVLFERAGAHHHIAGIATSCFTLEH